MQALTRRLIADGRYALALRAEAADALSEDDAGATWEALEARMALVPAGCVPIARPHGPAAILEVGAFYLDRHAVTNGQYLRFVAAGGYDDLELWPRSIWPALLQFTDRTGRPGPRLWERGTFDPKLVDHPVVGVSWFEAVAYARWVGKRLPTGAEWQKAAGCPEDLAGGGGRRYPWGDLFADGRANLGTNGPGHTMPVDAFPQGATFNGIYQMVGNVWEWLDDSLEAIPCEPGETLAPGQGLRRIAGGAFDTYLIGEAAVPFVTGQPENDRRSNIGFRCAVSADRLRTPSHWDDEPSSSRTGDDRNG